jgi:hypothetical protein
MSQTLRTTLSFHQHSSARRSLVPATSALAHHSLENLLILMQQILSQAKTDLLKPRQQSINRILAEAALLH